MVRVNGACHQFQPAVTTFRIEHADTGIETPKDCLDSLPADCSA